MSRLEPGEMPAGEETIHGMDHEIPHGEGELAELSKKAYGFLKENILSEALLVFEEILLQDPNNNYALVGLGDVERKRKDFRKALEYYQKCLELYPDNTYAVFGTADVYKSLGLHQKALQIWLDFIKNDHENVTVLTRIADSYRKTRDFTMSRDYYYRVLDLEPENPYALIGLGHLYFDFKDYREAMRAWERAYLKDPSHADVRILTSLGNCHRKLKTFKQGLPYFEKVLSEEPNNFYALFGMADCYRGMNEPDKSLEYWKNILDKDPRNKVIMTRAGDALRQMERYDEAEDFYSRALNIEYDMYAVLGLALVHKMRRQWESAVVSLRGILKNDPNNTRIYQELAECYIEMNKPEEAQVLLDQLLRRGVRNTWTQELIQRIKSPVKHDYRR